MKTTPIYYEGSPEQPLHILIEGIRSEMANTRGKLGDCCREWPQWKDRIEHIEGLLTCGLVALSGAAKEISEHHVKAKGGIPFCARGIGLDNCPGCYVCGGVPGLHTNISGFVRSKEDGDKVVAMFTSGAWMDFRPSEPQWIQVKIGVCDAHRANLAALMKATGDGGISKSDVDASLRIETVALAGA